MSRDRVQMAMQPLNDCVLTLRVQALKRRKHTTNVNLNLQIGPPSHALLFLELFQGPSKLMLGTIRTIALVEGGSVGRPFPDVECGLGYLGP